VDEKSRKLAEEDLRLRQERRKLQIKAETQIKLKEAKTRLNIANAELIMPSRNHRTRVIMTTPGETSGASPGG